MELLIILSSVFRRYDFVLENPDEKVRNSGLIFGVLIQE
jgi:hypothetical protein